MGFRFHRSAKIFPGIRLNFSKSGLGLSFGVKGYRVSIGPAGIRRTVSLPGTGISHIDQLYSPSNKNSITSIPANISNSPSGDINPNSNLFLSKILPITFLGLIGCLIIGGIASFLISFVNALSPPQPTISVNQIVSTSIAQITQQAIVEKMLGDYTQTAISIQIAVEETLKAPTETQIIPTIEPTFPPLPTPPPIQFVDVTLQPTNLSASGLVPIPLIILPTQNAPKTFACCKICSKGKACGNSCISRSYTCHKPPGCACNG